MMSKRRATVIKSYMVGKGIPSNNIETYGHGPVNFLSTNSTVEGRRMNRRVEIKLINAE
jgi:outer membrane protein OmpA-like peptidoglycan-associated protein